VAGKLWPLGKEQFFYPATPSLFKKLEQLSQRSNVSRGQAFEDFLTAVVCALAAETKEEEYMAMIERHKSGKRGRRGADLMPEMFAELVNAMSDSDADILGDLFQGSITYGEAGQYFTPEGIHNWPTSPCVVARRPHRYHRTFLACVMPASVISPDVGNAKPLFAFGGAHRGHVFRKAEQPKMAWLGGFLIAPKPHRTTTPGAHRALGLRAAHTKRSSCHRWVRRARAPWQSPSSTPSIPY
jgi:hypothetical protein